MENSLPLHDMALAHNAYIVAKDSNPSYVNAEWPGFQDFSEDLAEDLVCHVTTVRGLPSSMQ